MSTTGENSLITWSTLPGSLCVICLKPASTNSGNETRYLRLLDRYLDLEHCYNSEFQFCRECTSILASFSSLYDQMKQLELQVKWRVSKVKDIMESSDRLSSRVQFAKGFYQKKGKFPLMEQMYTWRRKVSKRCEFKLCKSFPKVVLNSLTSQHKPAPVVRGNKVGPPTLSPTRNADSCHVSVSSSSEDVRNGNTVRTSVAKWKCEFCNQYFNLRDSLRKHRSVTHFDKLKSTFECSFAGCKNTFTVKELLDRHVRIVHYGKCKFWCYICGKGYKTRYSFSKHLQSHQGRKSKPKQTQRFPCDKCKKVFQLKGSLTRHKIQCHSQSQATTPTPPAPSPASSILRVISPTEVTNVTAAMSLLPKKTVTFSDIAAKKSSKRTIRNGTSASTAQKPASSLSTTKNTPATYKTPHSSTVPSAFTTNTIKVPHPPARTKKISTRAKAKKLIVNMTPPLTTSTNATTSSPSAVKLKATKKVPPTLTTFKANTMTRKRKPLKVPPVSSRIKVSGIRINTTRKVPEPPPPPPPHPSAITGCFTPLTLSPSTLAKLSTTASKLPASYSSITKLQPLSSRTIHSSHPPPPTEIEPSNSIRMLSSSFQVPETTFVLPEEDSGGQLGNEQSGNIGTANPDAIGEVELESPQSCALFIKAGQSRMNRQYEVVADQLPDHVTMEVHDIKYETYTETQSPSTSFQYALEEDDPLTCHDSSESERNRGLETAGPSTKVQTNGDMQNQPTQTDIGSVTNMQAKLSPDEMERWCTICKRLFPSRTDFLQHFKFQHDLSSAGLSYDKASRCKQCTAFFVYSSQLTEHISQCHHRDVNLSYRDAVIQRLGQPLRNSVE